MARFLPLSMLVPLLVCLFPAGCENGTAPGSAFVVQDSAGIEIVESSEPQVEPGAWSVSPEPVLQIGQAEGAEHYLFGKIPIVGSGGMGGMFRLDDGRIVVCDGMTRTVRIFDQEGRFVTQFGRSGDGPGEFQVPIRACIPHGEVTAVSERNRVSYFDAGGQFLDMTSFDRASFANAYLFGVFPDGSLLVFQLDMESLTRANSASATGVNPVEATVSVAKPDGEPSGWTLPVHFSRMIMTTGGAGPFAAEQPFAPKLLLAIWGDAFVYGWADSYELQVFNRDGALKQIVRRAVDPSPVTAQDRKWYADSLFQRQQRSGTEAARQLSEGLIFPDHYAAYDLLLVDRLGDLWVRRFDPRGEIWTGADLWRRPSSWDVFDPSRRWLTTVTLPEGVAIHDIGEDYVLGVWRDELGVEYVRMYSLDRGGYP